jgi:hypothetical protein
MLRVRKLRHFSGRCLQRHVVEQQAGGYYRTSGASLKTNPRSSGDCREFLYGAVCTVNSLDTATMSLNAPMPTPTMFDLGSIARNGGAKRTYKT